MARGGGDARPRFRTSCPELPCQRHDQNRSRAAFRWVRLEHCIDLVGEVGGIYNRSYLMAADLRLRTANKPKERCTSKAIQKFQGRR